MVRLERTDVSERNHAAYGLKNNFPQGLYRWSTGSRGHGKQELTWTEINPGFSSAKFNVFFRRTAKAKVELKRGIHGFATISGSNRSPDVQVDILAGEMDGTIAGQSMHTPRVSTGRGNLHRHVGHGSRKSRSRAAFGVGNGDMVV